MTSKRELTYQSLREQLYASFRYGNDMMYVECDQMAILLGLEPPEGDDMDTANLSEDAIMAIARRDAQEQDTEPIVVPVYDDIEVD